MSAPATPLTPAAAPAPPSTPSQLPPPTTTMTTRYRVWEDQANEKGEKKWRDFSTANITTTWVAEKAKALRDFLHVSLSLPLPTTTPYAICVIVGEVDLRDLSPNTSKSRILEAITASESDVLQEHKMLGEFTIKEIEKIYVRFLKTPNAFPWLALESVTTRNIEHDPTLRGRGFRHRFTEDEEEKIKSLLEVEELWRLYGQDEMEMRYLRDLVGELLIWLIAADI